jgi:hypothetical protein
MWEVTYISITVRLRRTGLSTYFHDVQNVTAGDDWPWKVVTKPACSGWMEMGKAFPQQEAT